MLWACAAGTTSGVVAGILAGLTGSAAGGLSTTADALSNARGANNKKSAVTNAGSVSPVDEKTQKQFCELNPGTPNCQDAEKVCR